jgi:Mrp family chromosome partitioning ATPase
LAARGGNAHDAAVDAFVRRALPPAVAAATVADAGAAAPTAADDGDQDEEILLVPHTPQLFRPMPRPLPRPPCLVVVVRGLSGCGKSTFARTLGSAAAAAGRTFAVCSADKVR